MGDTITAITRSIESNTNGIQWETLPMWLKVIVIAIIVAIGLWLNSKTRRYDKWK